MLEFGTTATLAIVQVLSLYQTACTLHGLILSVGREADTFCSEGNLMTQAGSHTLHPPPPHTHPSTPSFARALRWLLPTSATAWRAWGVLIEKRGKKKEILGKQETTQKMSALRSTLLTRVGLQHLGGGMAVRPGQCCHQQV